MQFFTKPNVLFYEKTGCAGNARQKKLLKSCGVDFEVKSLLDTQWSKATLEPFFKGLTPKEMFNPFSPAIKNNEIDIANITYDEAVEMMIKEPILIKRPLIQINESYYCGFDIALLNEALNIDMDRPKDINSCTSSDVCTTV